MKWNGFGGWDEERSEKGRREEVIFGDEEEILVYLIFFFDFSVTEANFNEVSYIDWKDKNPKAKTLCSRLKNGICETKKSFSKGNHNLTVTVLDEAGNSWSEMINFSVV